MTTYDQIQDNLRQTPRRWLITGAAGFIGSNLVEKLLTLGQEVVGLDNFATGFEHNIEDVKRTVGEEAAARFRFIKGDIRNPDDCARACKGIDIVSHQAALGSVPRSIENPRATHEVNVDGFVNMLIAARDAGVKRFVYASSSSVYGDHPDLPKVEANIGTPLSPYAVTKRTNELYGRTFFDHYALETIGLRYFNVFGPRQDPDGAYAAVIPKWIGQMLKGERPFVNGDGETSRDFCYVANAVQANILAGMAPTDAAGRFYNIAVGDRTTLNELYGMIRGSLDGRAPHEIEETPEYRDFRPGDVRHSEADISAAAEAFGYAPDVRVGDGIRLATDAYLERVS